MGIEPATFQFAGRHSIHWATPARAAHYLFIYLCPISFLNLGALCFSALASSSLECLDVSFVFQSHLRFSLPHVFAVFLCLTLRMPQRGLPHAFCFWPLEGSCLGHGGGPYAPWDSFNFPDSALDLCTHRRPMGKSWQVGLVTGPPLNCNLLSESTCSH